MDFLATSICERSLRKSSPGTPSRPHRAPRYDIVHPRPLLGQKPTLCQHILWKSSEEATTQSHAESPNAAPGRVEPMKPLAGILVRVIVRVSSRARPSSSMVRAVDF